MVTMEELKSLIREEVGRISVKSSGEVASDHVPHCPDCYKKTIQAMNEKSDFVCENCGLPLGDEQFIKGLDSCPNCAHTKVKKVR